MVVRAVTQAGVFGDTMPTPSSDADASMDMTSKSASRARSIAPSSRAVARVLVLLMGVLFTAASIDASAATGRARVRLAQAQPAVSADQAAAAVRAVSGGRILDVRLDSRSRPPIYRVKVLLEGGRVRVYRVDAASGRVLE